MTRVLMAVDGSELDTELGDTARRLFADAQLFAINVQDVPHMATYPVARGAVFAYPPVVAGGVAPLPMADEIAETHGEVRRDRARDVASTSSPRAAVPIGEIGDPTSMILAAARDHDVDVVVVGTHDRSWWSELLRPSVSDTVLANASVPVLLVRAGPEGVPDGDDQTADDG